MTYRDIAEDREIRVKTVQQIGGKTFFLRDGCWVDSVLTEAQEKKVQRIRRFGQEYFDLLRRHGQSAGKYFAMEGDVTLVLDGQAYAFSSN